MLPPDITAVVNSSIMSLKHEYVGLLAEHEEECDSCCVLKKNKNNNIPEVQTQRS